METICPPVTIGLIATTTTDGSVVLGATAFDATANLFLTADGDGTLATVTFDSRRSQGLDMIGLEPTSRLLMRRETQCLA